MRISVDEKAADGPVRVRFAQGEIPALYAAAEEKARRALDAIAAVPARGRTVKNTLVALDDALAEFSDSASPLALMSDVSMDEAVRREGFEAEASYGKFLIEVFTREDLYAAVKARKPKGGAEARLYSETVREFELNGLSLPGQKRARFKQLLSRLEDLEAEFVQNLNNDSSTIEFTRRELEGVPQGALSRFRSAGGGKFTLTLKTPDYVAVMENARDPGTRMRMMLAHESRAAGRNVQVLEETMLLRREAAALLGFESWSDYKARSRMAGTGTAVKSFLDGLKGPLKKRRAEDVARLLELKKELFPGADSVDAWDLPFLDRQLRKRDFSVDEEKIREYFPLGRTMDGMMGHFSRVFGVGISEEKGAEAWAPDVRLYRISGKGGKTLAHFYLDLLPREGKYGNASVHSIVTARERSGVRTSPLHALLMELEPGPGGGEPLLKHSEVVALFHEFGHMMADSLSRPEYYRLSSEFVKLDAVEIASQAFEGWAWAPETIRKISGHYLRPEEKLPEGTLRMLAASRDLDNGIAYARQLAFALMDQSFHAQAGSPDSVSECNRIFLDLMGVPLPEGNRFPAIFHHAISGYDAGYYSYMWSEAYSLDAFSRFETEGYENEKTGAAFRELILESANTEEPAELLKRFLGREPGREAFLRRLGIPESGSG
jgi:thimet oligopeptidase